MKIDARLVKQSVGMIVGGVIFAWSAMDKGRIDGIKEGKRLQAGCKRKVTQRQELWRNLRLLFFALTRKNLLALWSEDHEQRRILCEKTNFGTIRLRLAT